MTQDPSQPAASPSTGEEAYRLDAVCQQRVALLALDQISLTIRRNALTSLIGPNGSGKTTLLRLLNRLEDPSAGTLSLFGRPIAAYPVRELRSRVAFVFQAPVMFAGTVHDNLVRPWQIAKCREQPSSTEIATLLETVELDASFAKRDASSLSGGEKQRVALARALSRRPEVVLLDEPTAALDPEVAERLLATLARLRVEQRLTMVMVTHRLKETLPISDDFILLDHGKVVESGRAADLLHTPRTARAREFLHSALAPSA